MAKEQLNQALDHLKDHQNINFIESQFPPGTWVEQRPNEVGTAKYRP